MIKVGLRSRLLICGITLIAGYSYWYAGDPVLKLIASLVFFVSAGVMVWQFVHYFGKHIVNIVKIMCMGRKAVSWVEISEFNELAKRMGVKLHRKRPFGIRKGLNNAYANCLTGQIIFGEDLLQRLGSQERLALAAHELTHLKQNHWVRMFQLLLIVGLIVTLSLSLTSGPAIVSNLTCAAAQMITFVFVSWWNEFAADKGAGLQAGQAATISLLQGIVPASQWRRETETHPSITGRVSRLQKMQPLDQPLLPAPYETEMVKLRY